MIYLFTWNSDFLVKEKVKSWKDHFISKYWDFNIIHIKNIETVDNNFLTLNITSTSFLAEKKLIIIDIETKNEKNDIIKNNWKTNQKEENLNQKEELLIKLLSNIPEDNIILINIINPDKRTKFYKFLLKVAEIKEFNTNNENLFSLISNKYKNKISTTALNTLITYKSYNLSKIISEIEKLLIIFDYIDKKEIVENIIPELEVSIFLIIDDLFNKNLLEAIKKINITLDDTNIYAFYNNLLANIRTNIYIYHLKYLWKKTAEISQILDLQKRSFLIDKKYKISYNELKKFYIRLLNVDKKMKSWNLIWTQDSDFKYELENVILKIVNN